MWLHEVLVVMCLCLLPYEKSKVKSDLVGEMWNMQKHAITLSESILINYIDHGRFIIFCVFVVFLFKLDILRFTLKMHSFRKLQAPHFLHFLQWKPGTVPPPGRAPPPAPPTAKIGPLQLLKPSMLARSKVEKITPAGSTGLLNR